MKPTRLILTAAAFVAALVNYPLSAQTPGGVTKTNDALENGQRWHFSGKVADVNPSAHTIAIEADSLPSTGGPAPGTLPYTVPKSIPMDRFHKGDRVTGDMILRNHLTKVVNVRRAGDHPGGKVGYAPAHNEGPGVDSMRNHVADRINRQTQHWHFDGKVSTIDPGARQITINADSIPQQMGGKTTLPYKVPASVSLESFHEGDIVNGDLVVRNNRSFVENVKHGPTPTNSAGMKVGRKARGVN